MMDILSWLFFVVFIVGLITVVIMLIRGYVKSGAVSPPFGERLFQPKPQKRLGIIEEANIDGRRKLVIIQRDDVEHLVMIGGPVDIVIETGIDRAGEIRGRAKEGATPRVVHSNAGLPPGAARPHVAND